MMKSKFPAKKLSGHAELKSEPISNLINQGQMRKMKQTFEVERKYKTQKPKYLLTRPSRVQKI